MSASIWAPGSELVVVDAESTNLSQIFTASAGQTVFNLTEYSYTPNTGSIAVYRGGQKLVLGIDYTETSSSSVTLQGISPAAGETFEVVAIIGSASAFAGQAEAAAVIAVASAAAALHPWEAEAEGIHYDLGNVRIGGSGKRITGDFSNATVANRLMFQTSTVNGNSTVGVLPNGTATTTAFRAFNSVDPTNATFFSHLITTAEAQLSADKTGSGSYLPMTFYTGGSERVRIDTGGQVTFNGLANFVSDISLINGTDQYVYFDGALHLAKNGTGDRLVIDTNGYVGIGQPPARKLDVAGGASFIQDTAATTGAIVIRQNAGDTVGGFIQWVNNANSAGKGWICMDTTSNLIFGPNSSEKFRFGSSGQLGIGGANYGAAGQVLTSNGSGSAPSWSNAGSGLGVGQTYQDVTASRAFNTTYTNSTGKPIFVSVTCIAANGSPAVITVSGISFNSTSAFTANANAQASFVVPDGATYSVSSSNMSSIGKWVELR